MKKNDREVTSVNWKTRLATVNISNGAARASAPKDISKMASNVRFCSGTGGYALKRKTVNVHIPGCHGAAYLKSDCIIKQLLTQLSAFPTLLASWNHNNITSLPESGPFWESHSHVIMGHKSNLGWLFLYYFIFFTFMNSLNSN